MTKSTYSTQLRSIQVKPITADITTPISTHQPISANLTGANSMIVKFLYLLWTKPFHLLAARRKRYIGANNTNDSSRNNTYAKIQHIYWFTSANKNITNISKWKLPFHVPISAKKDRFRPKMKQWHWWILKCMLLRINRWVYLKKLTLFRCRYVQRRIYLVSWENWKIIIWGVELVRFGRYVGGRKK